MENKKPITLQDLGNSHEQTVLESLQKHRLNQTLFVHFPNHRKVPFFGKIGVWLVNKSGGIIATKYQYVNDTINSNARQEK